MKKLILLALLALAACGGGKKALRFTAIPDQNTTELERKFTPVAAYLAAKLDVPVEYVPARDYAASVEMFRNGDIQLAWFGGLTGVQARHAVPGARAIVQGAKDPDFYSYFIAHRDSGLEPGDDFPAGIAGLKFTFGDEASTSGRLMPEYHILEHSGKTAREFFTETPAFSGSHDQTAELVQSGQYQAGAINYSVYDRRVREGKLDPEVCRVIWTTPTFADYNLTAHPVLEERFGAGFIDRLRQALVAMDDPKLLAAFDREKLIPARNEDFEGIRKTALKLDMLR